MMKIKMKTLVCGPNINGQPGQVLDVDPETANNLIGGGYAELVGLPPVVPSGAVGDQSESEQADEADHPDSDSDADAGELNLDQIDKLTVAKAIEALDSAKDDQVLLEVAAEHAQKAGVKAHAKKLLAQLLADSADGEDQQ